MSVSIFSLSVYLSLSFSTPLPPLSLTHTHKTFWILFAFINRTGKHV